MRPFVFFFFLLVNLNFAFGQNQVAQKMLWYGKTKLTTNLFVHFDKNIYANNETAYFTGYLIKPGLNLFNTHSIMAVAFIRDADSTVVLEDKFVMENGLSFGSITLPDSILTGNYRFLAYTDKLTNGIPDVIFEQPITLKTNIDPAFKANMKLIEPEKGENKSHRILLSVTSKENSFLPKPINISYQYGKTNVVTKTDQSGQLLISLPKQNSLTDPNLYVKLKYAKDSSFINMPLPQAKNKATVKFYPEGGNLVIGLSSNVGWEVKDQQKMPVATKAFLYENDVIIDTVSSYGIGKFWLAPIKGANYSLKLIHSGLADSIYLLPKAIDRGIVIYLKDALSKDTLTLTIKNKAPGKLNFLIHNFRESYLEIPFDMRLQKNTVKIPIGDVPKGLMTLTVLDSLNMPLAERIFFAHYNNAEKLSASTDKQIYTQREKVSLSLKLNLDTMSIVSISCTQDNRFEPKKMTDIESYTYLSNELNALPIVLKETGYKDVNYLEQVMLVKGWRRYNWPNLQTTTADESFAKKDSLQMLGAVRNHKKELEKAVTIGTFSEGKIRILNTSNKGYFNFNTEELILPSKKNYLFVNDSKYNYKFEVIDSFVSMSKKLAKSNLSEQLMVPSAIANNAMLVLKGNEKAIRLKEVVITGAKDQGTRYTGSMGTNSCGDYVCMYNILNCRNHVSDPNNREPVKGLTYSGSNGPYPGCTNTINDQGKFFKFNGIHLQKEFYLDDYKDPKEPAFFSTIYWNYGALLKSNTNCEISFYTSDITGKFKIVIQGISNNDVVYSESFFEVKPKINL